MELLDAGFHNIFTNSSASQSRVDCARTWEVSKSQGLFRYKLANAKRSRFVLFELSSCVYSVRSFGLFCSERSHSEKLRHRVGLHNQNKNQTFPSSYFTCGLRVKNKKGYHPLRIWFSSEFKVKIEEEKKSFMILNLFFHQQLCWASSKISTQFGLLY